MKSVLLSGVILLFLFSCNKSKTVNGSPYTKAMCGSRSFHYINSGYDPYLQKYVSDSSDVSIDIAYIDAGTVSFGSYTFVYDSVNSSGVAEYHYVAGNNGIDYGYLNFDHIANTVFVFQSIHVSAGGGNWVSTYTSF